MNKDLAILSKSLTTPNQRHDMVLIFDRSGSMCGTEPFVVKGYQRLLKAVNEKHYGKVKLTTVLFDHEINTVCMREPLENARPIEYYSRGSTALFDSVGTAIEYIKECHRKEKQAFDAEEDRKEQAFNYSETIAEQQFNAKEELAKEKYEKAHPFSKNKYVKKTYQKRSYLNRKEYVAPDVHFMIYSDGMENDSKIFDQPALASLVQERMDNGWKFYYYGDFCLDIPLIAEQMNIPVDNTLSFVRDENGFANLFKLITGMVKYLAINGYVPENWKDLADHDSPLFGIKDEKIIDLFKEGQKALTDNENYLADLEKYAMVNGFDDEFKNIFSKIMLNLNTISRIMRSLISEKQPRLADVLQIYFVKQTNHGKAALQVAISKSTTAVASANVICLSALRDIAQGNILNCQEFNRYYDECMLNFNTIESYLRKSNSQDFPDLSLRLEKLLQTQKGEFMGLITDLLITRKKYIDHIIQSSSVFIFGRDKNKKMSFIEALYMKSTYQEIDDKQGLRDELLRLNAIYKSFKIRNDIRTQLIESGNEAIIERLNDERDLEAWIRQVNSITGMPVTMQNMSALDEIKSEEVTFVNEPTLVNNIELASAVDNETVEPKKLELLPGKITEKKEDENEC